MQEKVKMKNKITINKVYDGKKFHPKTLDEEKNFVTYCLLQKFMVTKIFIV